jgi:outer membrane lipoprotein-sorting protein
MKRVCREQELEQALRRTAPGGPPVPDFASWRARHAGVVAALAEPDRREKRHLSVVQVIRLGRTLVRTRKRRLGAVAAAVLLATVFLMRGTRPAWSVEQTIAAMKKVKVVLMTGKGYCDGQRVDFRFWVRPPGDDSEALRMRYECGCERHTVIVVQGHTMYQYFPTENLVTVSDCSQLEDLQYWYEGAQFSPWLTGRLFDILKLVGRGWQQTTVTDPATGKEQIHVTCSHPPSNISFFLVVDPETKLIQRAKLWKNLTQAGEPVFDAQVFTYNPELPDGFFEFKAPEGTLVINEQAVEESPARFDHPDEVMRGEGFMVLADRRMFAMMALLNATGFDEEAANETMHPVRVKVRELVAAEMARYPQQAEAWRRYIQTRQVAIFQYEDFALSLSTDYPFRRIRPDAEVGYSWAVQRLPGMPQVLNDFWRTVRLDEIWSQVKPEYLAEIHKYDLEKMQRQMDFLWGYLRMPRRDTLTLVNVPNLLDTHYHAIGAHYENFYYTVESPGSHAYGLNIHEYLHSIVNSLVRANFASQQAKLSKYYEAGKAGPLSKTYQSPVVFTFESLVRALDHRLAMLQSGDPADKKRIEGQITWETDNGLKLTRPFYELLPEFESSGRPFDQFLPVLFDRLPECGQ